MSWTITGGSYKRAFRKNLLEKTMQGQYLTDMLDAVKRLASEGYIHIHITKEEG